MNTPPPEGGGFGEPLEVGFFRLEPTQVPARQRAGLAFCRLAVEASGGRIWLEELPGPGALLVFTVPVASTAAAEPAVALPASPPRLQYEHDAPLHS